MPVTSNEVLELITEMETHYTKLQQLIREDELFYNLEFGDLLSLPREFKAQGVVLPAAREMVDAATDHIDPRIREVTVPRRNTSKAAIDQAGKARLFYDAFLRYLERVNPSVFRNAGKNLSGYGMGVMKLLVDESKDGVMDMPFTLLTPHPFNIMPDPWHDPPEFVIERRDINVRRAKEKYPLWDSKGRTQSATLKAYEYWDDTSRAMIVGGQVAEEPKEHDNGTHPYIIASSGLGHESRELNAHDQFVGVLRYIKHVLMAQSRQFSIIDIVLKKAAWPERVMEGDRAAEVGKEFRIEYGKTNVLPPGVKITNLTPELPPDLVFQFLGLTDSFISSVSPRVLRGGREPGTSSGFDNQLQLLQARIRYEPLVAAMQTMMTLLCMKAGIFMEKVVKKPVSINAGNIEDEFQSVGSDVFKNYHSVNVRINVTEPEDQIRRHNDILQLTSAGLMSELDGRKAIDPAKDPLKTERQITKEQLKKALLPVIGQGVAQQVMDRLGLAESIEALVNNAAGGRGRQPAGPDEAEGPAISGSRSDQGRLRRQDGRATGTGR